MPARPSSDKLVIRGAREHNLRNINLELPRDGLIVLTGLSGSGKSSLAFDTIYGEGQRRFLESLSAYSRKFVSQLKKPAVDFILGLSPVISIEQKSISKNPRSTVGTMTDIYDYLPLPLRRLQGQASDAPADRRSSVAVARGHTLPGARADRSWAQGHVRDPAH